MMLDSYQQDEETCWSAMTLLSPLGFIALAESVPEPAPSTDTGL